MTGTSGQCIFGDLLGPLQRLTGCILQHQPAKRQRHALLDLGAAHIDQFERTTAEIARNAIRVGDARRRRRERPARLSPARQDVDLDTADPLRLLDEGRTILRIAAGRGCNAEHAADLHGIAQRPKAPQRREALRPRHPAPAALWTEPGGRRSGQHLFVEDRGRAPRQPL